MQGTSIIIWAPLKYKQTRKIILLQKKKKGKYKGFYYTCSMCLVDLINSKMKTTETTRKIKSINVINFKLKIMQGKTDNSCHVSEQLKIFQNFLVLFTSQLK